MMKKIAAVAMLSALSMAAQATALEFGPVSTFEVDALIPAFEFDATTTFEFDATPKSSFRSVQQSQVISIGYFANSTAGMPGYLSAIQAGAAVRMRITVPPGVTMSGIQMESGHWRDTRVGVVSHNGPYCSNPSNRPDIPTCSEAGVPPSLDYVYSNDLYLLGRSNDVFPMLADRQQGVKMTTSERTVYGWIKSFSGDVGLSSMTISYQIGDAQLYNAWVGTGGGPVVPGTLTISPATVSGQVGGKVSFTLSGTSVANTATIVSNNPAVVSCPATTTSTTFECSLLSIGAATVIVTSGGSSATAVVTVSPDAGALTISPAAISGEAGTNVSFTLSGTGATGAVVVSSNTAVVSCPTPTTSTTLTCSLLSAGTAQVIVTAGANSAIAVVTVTAPPQPVTPSLEFLTPTATSGIRINNENIYRQYAAVGADDQVNVQFSFVPLAADVGKTVDLFNIIVFDDPVFDGTIVIALVENGYLGYQPTQIALEAIPKYKTVQLSSAAVTLPTFSGSLGTPDFPLLVSSYAGYSYKDATGRYFYRLFPLPLMLEFK